MLLCLTCHDRNRNRHIHAQLSLVNTTGVFDIFLVYISHTTLLAQKKFISSFPIFYSGILRASNPHILLLQYVYITGYQLSNSIL